MNCSDGSHVCFLVLVGAKKRSIRYKVCKIVYRVLGPVFLTRSILSYGHQIFKCHLTVIVDSGGPILPLTNTDRKWGPYRDSKDKLSCVNVATRLKPRLFNPNGKISLGVPLRPWPPG